MIKERVKYQKSKVLEKARMESSAYIKGLVFVFWGQLCFVATRRKMKKVKYIGQWIWLRENKGIL